ncbi:MAG TPA: hypothetical protein VMT58_01560, partial [Candidatus Binataceae bacterium]|nr:hypothetical protein [Candidatus Binataceae bacterium]
MQGEKAIGIRADAARLACIRRALLTGAIIGSLFIAPAARADSLAMVTSVGAQGANDTVNWSQVGPDAMSVATSFGAASAGGISITISLAGSSPTSLISVVCPAAECSWSGGKAGSTPFTAGDSLIWTADGGSSGNGPITMLFGSKAGGAGALIQADGPAQFTAKIQAFTGATSLGSFTEASDASGDPVYIGVI